MYNIQEIEQIVLSSFIFEMSVKKEEELAEIKKLDYDIDSFPDGIKERAERYE